MIIHYIDQGSDPWLALRSGLPTASNFSKLITSTGIPSKSMADYAITLAGEIYSGKPLDAWEGNAHTERGKLLEDDARKMYAFLLDVEPERVGFVTDNDCMYGCSPDGFVGNDGGLEIKCLKAENHIKAILYLQKNRKCPPDYVQQVQGNILVCEREWWDLLFYHPDFPSRTIRINRDSSFIDALKSQINAVIEERDNILINMKMVASSTKEA
jgi:hypothetical protein